MASTQSVAQTFTAGLGGRLDRVDLLLSKFGTPAIPLTIDIRNVTGGVPGTTILATSSLPPSAVGTTAAFVPFPFTVPAPVTAGTPYAIVAYSFSPLGNTYGWLTSAAAPYTPGLAFTEPSSPPGTNWNPISGNDMAFKTYVDVPPTGSTGSTGSTAFCGGQPATKVGTEGADVIAGSSGVDVIAGLGGNDRISGLAGKDIVCGGPGNDKLNGGAGNDKLLGQAGKDTLKGGPGKDKLKGGPGKDKQIQ